MKKMLKIALTLLLVINFANAGSELKITKQAVDVISNLKTSDFHTIKDGNNNKVMLLRNTNRAKKFMRLNLDYNVFDKSEMKEPILQNFKYDREFVQISSNDSDPFGICRSFVQALVKDSDIKPKKYYRLSFRKAPPGSIIISKPRGKTGHIAIVMRQDSDGVWVIDQNADPGYNCLNDSYKVEIPIHGVIRKVTTGTVSIHKIMFKKKNSKSLKDAHSYFTIKK